MIYLPQWLIVYGTDRNSGKTTLITDIIRRFRQQLPITALKISPHFHEIDDDAEVVFKTREYVIVRETKTGTGKDSARMLDAGAAEVLYIQVWDQNLERVMPLVLSITGSNRPVICESGWARNLVEPGLFLVLHRKGHTVVKESAGRMKELASRWIEFDGYRFGFSVDEITYDNGWKLK